MTKLLLPLLMLLYPLFTLADIQSTFESLRNSGKDFSSTGAICEEVARLQISQMYPMPQYSVVTGISYGNSQQILGELDVIVFDNQTQNAIQITEVKCWQDPSRGLIKAKEQRKRFLENIKSQKISYFKSTSIKKAYSPLQFNSVSRYTNMAQLGAKKFGFADELPFTLSELMALREKLITCQYRGECLTLNVSF